MSLIPIPPGPETTMFPPLPVPGTPARAVSAELATALVVVEAWAAVEAWTTDDPCATDEAAEAIAVLLLVRDLVEGIEIELTDTVEVVIGVAVEADGMAGGKEVMSDWEVVAELRVVEAIVAFEVGTVGAAGVLGATTAGTVWVTEDDEGTTTAGTVWVIGGAVTLEAVEKRNWH